MRGHKNDESQIRHYHGWYLYQCGADDNMWSCAKQGWTSAQYDANTAWMPVERTQRAITAWIDEHGTEY